MKNKNDFADFENQDTVIGAGVSVTGNIKTTGDIQINGQFKGSLATSGDIIIGELAEVKASIEASNAYIAGDVDGDINSTERLEILATGRVNGNVKSHSLVIEPGGLLKGKSTMSEAVKDKPSISPTYEVDDSK